MTDRASWIIHDLWSRADQIAAMSQGWGLAALNGEWSVYSVFAHPATKRRFKTVVEATRWVHAQAEEGSAFHERALHAMITANMME